MPKNLKNEELHKIFSQTGRIKSLKISINSDYSSRGYGFICFEEEHAAIEALQLDVSDGIHQMKFEPKDRRQMRRLINNIYVKNIPNESSESDIRKLFE